MKKKLWRHQIEAVDRAKTRPKYGLFFEMGCGKTATAINILLGVLGRKGVVPRTLIFCPPIVIENWKREFGIHSHIGPQFIVPLVGPGSRRIRVFEKNAWEYGCAYAPGPITPRIFVTNYESLLMPDLYQAFLNWEPEMVICDESHKLKDPTTKRTRKMVTMVNGDFGVRPPVPNRLLLSGTPILNSPMDIFGQFLVMDGGKTFGKNQFLFRAQYFYDKNAPFRQRPNYFPDWRIRPDSMKSLNAIIAENAMSVKKSECLDLPPLVRQTVYVEMSTEQTKVYEEMKKDLISYMGDKACVATLSLTKALRLLQIASGYVQFDDGTQKHLKTPKMDALKELIEQLAPDHKILVWACFKENYAQIRQVCEELKIDYVEVHGEVPGTQKMANVDKFNREDKYRVFIGHPGSGGIGINLVSASYSIFYSRNHSLEYDLQAEARNHRGGSEIHEKITRIDLVAKDTIDELVLTALSNKQELGESLLKDWKTKL